MIRHIKIKRISSFFFIFRIPVPTLLISKYENKYFTCLGFLLITTSNHLDSKLSFIKHTHLIILSGSLAKKINSIILNQRILAFWSYKDTLILMLPYIQKNVYRISGERSVVLNHNNYIALKRMLKFKLLMFPKPKWKNHINKTVISCEEYIDADSIGFPPTTNQIFEGLFSLYRKTHKECLPSKLINNLVKQYKNHVPLKFNRAFEEICNEKINLIKTQCNHIDKLQSGMIHGDLTVRNISRSSDGIRYYDLDRLETSFPEFDFFLLWIDQEMYRTKTRSYKQLLHLASRISMIEDVKKSLNHFYKQIPSFSYNQNYFIFIADLFFIRTVAYIFADAKFNSRIAKTLNK